LAKRISEKEKEIMISSFTEGKTVDQLIKEFNFSRLTIVRNLKKYLGEEKYKKLILKSKNLNQKAKSHDLKNHSTDSKEFDKENSDNFNSVNNSDELLNISQFTEITPLDFDIENSVQKDLSSVPISYINFPNIVYMIVDKKIELEIKYLRDYPDWQFLSQEELDRKTIEIFFDLKIAKRFCNKDQKVIKVPNPNVFSIVAPLLLKKGISRIVTTDKLISL
jgi:hypothetical protein